MPASPRLDFAFVDSKISRFNDLISLSLGNTDSNLVIIETIDREMKFFSKDGLHLNKRKGCAALTKTILSCLYSVLRPKPKKARRGSEHRNKSVPRPKPKNRRSHWGGPSGSSSGRPRPHVNRGGHRVRVFLSAGFGLGRNGDDDLTGSEETGCSSIPELD